MAKIITCSKKIENLTGIKADEFITTLYMRDALRGEKPFLIERADKKKIFVTANLEKANIEHWQPQNIDSFHYYKTYPVFVDQQLSDEFDDLQEAIRASIPLGEVIKVESDMLATDYLMLQEEYCVEVVHKTGEKDWYFYEIEREAVCHKIGRKHDKMAQSVFKIIKNERDKKALRPYLAYTDDYRYEAIEKELETLGLEQILLTSPLNVQEFTGIPYHEAKDKRVMAFVETGNSKVRICASAPINLFAGMTPIENKKSMMTFIKPSKALGVELQSMALDDYLALNLETMELVECIDALRNIREKLAHLELPYYIIGAKATYYGLQQSINFVRDKRSNKRPVSEAEAFSEYKRHRNLYLKIHDLPVKMDIYQAVAWCGNRSLYCGFATDFMIDDKNTTFRIDVGDFVMDVEDGFIHAASDSCLTYCANPQVNDCYNVLFDIMRNKSFKSISPNVEANQVWHSTMEALHPYEPMFKESGLMPRDVQLRDIYNRNVGHTMSKQTRCVRMLSKDNPHILEEGMVGTVEIPFGYGQNAISVEEMWFNAKDRVINLSRC